MVLQIGELGDLESGNVKIIEEYVKEHTVALIEKGTPLIILVRYDLMPDNYRQTFENWSKFHGGYI